MTVYKGFINVRKMMEKTGRKMETVAREVSQDLAEEVVRRTPVDTGFLRGSWFAQVGSAEAAFEPVKDKDGAATIASIALDVASKPFKIGDTISILNQAAYARHVEFGTSRMSPRGMVRSTVADAPQIAARTIQRIKRI